MQKNIIYPYKYNRKIMLKKNKILVMKRALLESFLELLSFEYSIATKFKVNLGLLLNFYVFSMISFLF
jgi:hypothetical protein